uniref:PAN domain protein n=1 Tax=Elaeophora elaphi TaxID=1147741 RepID=A0A0R3RMT7_9BILA
MKPWLCLSFLTLIFVQKCVSEKRESKDTDSIMDHDNTGKRQGTEFGSSLPSEVISNETSLDGAYSTKRLSIAEATENARSVSQQRQRIIGKPDLSDVCFRAYNECIVVNAQPYERRSNMQLQECKQQCMQSQNGVYNCRSLVYDAANKICDFFAHQGDQLPAKLLKYYEHLYLEPTFANECDLKYAKKSKSERADSANGKVSNVMLLNDSSKKDTNQQICEKGKVAKYLRTQGFKFDSTNRIDLYNYNLDACIHACTNNIDDKGRPFGCRSFDYSHNGCSLFGEAVAPRATRYFKQSLDNNYYEKICVDDDLMSDECQSINRFPQMILVGFAEAVVTASSFTGCFENCLKSRQLFAMNCTSAVYFYEELEQNCILNSENRQTQKNLFVEENSDIVDYFELSCLLRKRKKMMDDLLFKS